MNFVIQVNLECNYYFTYHHFGFCKATSHGPLKGNKGNKQWVWLALDTVTREIVGVYIGARDEAAASADCGIRYLRFIVSSKTLPAHEFFALSFAVFLADGGDRDRHWFP